MNSETRGEKILAIISFIGVAAVLYIGLIVR
jgi:hypothetical protein